MNSNKIFMRLSYLIAGALMLMVAVLASSPHAFSFYLSANAVHTYGTEAAVDAYATSPAAFSVQSQYTNVRVDNLGDHAVFHLLAPDCMSGTETITVRATDGNTTQSQTFTLTNLPAHSCTSYIEPTPQINGFYVPSSLTFSQSFDATHYDLQLDTLPGCIPMTVGQTVPVRIRLQNDGAALSVTLKAVDEDDGATLTQLSRTQFSLDRNELESTNAYVRAISAGTHYVSFEALRGAIVVGRASVCIQVVPIFHASLSVPAHLDASACQLTSVPVQITNDGTADQSFVVQGDGITPIVVPVAAGQTQHVFVDLNASGLRPDENVVSITAQGDHTKGTAYVVVNVIPCVAQVLTQPINIQPETLSWTIRVTNDQDTPLRNVTLWVTGIPSSWTQQSDSTNIPPHSFADLTVHVTRTTDEPADPVIHVLANGKEIAQHSVGPIAAGPGITGRLVSAFSDNWLWILLALLLVVAALLFLRARDQHQGAADASQPPADSGSTDENTDAYKEKVHSVKVKVQQNSTSVSTGDGSREGH